MGPSVLQLHGAGRRTPKRRGRRASAEDAERRMETKRLTAVVIGAAIEVQKIFGPGLLESAYSGALAHELKLRRLRLEREVAIPANYKGVTVGPGFRADFIVEKQLVLELKTVEAL